MDGFVTSNLIDQVRRTLDDSTFRNGMVDHNYSVAGRFYGYTILRDHLRSLVASLLGE